MQTKALPVRGVNPVGCAYPCDSLPWETAEGDGFFYARVEVGDAAKSTYTNLLSIFCKQMIRLALVSLVAVLSLSACQPSEAPESGFDASAEADDGAVVSSREAAQEADQTASLRDAARRQQLLDAEASSAEWQPQPMLNPEESSEVTLTRAEAASAEGRLH